VLVTQFHKLSWALRRDHGVILSPMPANRFAEI
jgi:hypothetical protein